MSKIDNMFSDKKSGMHSQRPLRVGEEIRHALSDIFLRNESRAASLYDAVITISEVRVAPDMKNATAFFMPLAGQNKEVLLEALREAAPELRHHVSKRVKLRYTPRLHFSLDASFDAAQRIETILKTPEVSKDLSKDATDDEGQS